MELAHSSDNPHADLFVRICEVDAEGPLPQRQRRLRAARPGTPAADVVRLELDAVAHRFAAGNRIRLLVAGGSLPRWERNLGTGDDPATTRTMTPSRRTLLLAGSRLLLPVKA